MTAHELATAWLSYGSLFADVQMERVFPDGKTFVDAQPLRMTPPELATLYASQRTQPGFSLPAFVQLHFKLPRPAATPAPLQDMDAHIQSLWQQLRRQTHAAAGAHDTLVPLPQPFVVPGGRFRELYYWDTYFTMLGLVQDGQRAAAEAMLANFASLVDRFGFIPNSNRGYMFSRSQPPFFHKMVELLAGPEDPVPAFQRYLPQLRREYAYWMAGADGLPAGSAQAHVARLPDGSLLNRYWDTLEQPRPESFREDVLTARRASGPAARVYRDLRAGAESGWDFSSRWCADPDRIETIQTTSILPVDLNALLWGLEQALAQGCAQAGAAAEAAAFADAALRRRDAIERFMWSTPQGHYVDYHWPSATPGTQLTAAALVPLFAGLATRTRAAASAQALVTGGLLAPNGLLTTTHRSGQQWDAPNGWAPLQWMAVQGLARYGHEALARDIAARWVGMVQRVFRRTGLLLEKYDVTQDQPGGGGEYETQDGFGWTNGTYRALQEWIRLTAPPTKSA